MGNFCSPHHSVSSTAAAALQRPNSLLWNPLATSSAVDDFTSLLALKFPVLAAHAQFVLVPGPNDSGGNRVLPFPSLSVIPTASSNKIAHLHLASNPCRIRYGTNGSKEMVIFRYDMLHLLQQHQIRLPFEEADDDSDDDDITLAKLQWRSPHCCLLKALLDQGTLMPVTSVVPVYWNYSHALSLYPLPDCLVVSGAGGGGGDGVGTHENYWKCDVIQTTSFHTPTTSAYAVYRPGADDDDGDDGTGHSVEFCTLDMDN
jgi:hypothetical protein